MQESLRANAHQMRTGSASASNLAAISSRLNEKQQLGYLNDRLATYIERVRQLEQENKHLQIYIKRVEESIRTKTDQEKINFEDELQRIYDTLGADNEKLFNENEKLRAENVKLKTKIPELQQFNHESEKGRIRAETEVRELSAKIQGLLDEKNLWEQEAHNINEENLNLRRKRQELEDLLLQERALRAEAEKRLQDLLKDFEKFKADHDQILEIRYHEYLEKLEQTRRDLAGAHEAQLHEALDNLRKRMNEELVDSRKPLQEMYEKKIEGLNADMEGFRGAANEANANLKQYYMSYQSSQESLNKLTEKIRVLEEDKTKLQNELRSALSKYDALQQQATAERKALEREIDVLMQQYAELLDAKVQLDTEIAAYRGLLETEEHRLQIYASPRPGSAASSTKSGRRVMSDV